MFNKFNVPLLEHLTNYLSCSLSLLLILIILHDQENKTNKKRVSYMTFTTYKNPLKPLEISFFQDQKMKSLGHISLLRCFTGCRDHGTRIWNLSDNPIELQVRVSSTLKRVHTLKPGSSKRLKAKKIYKAYMPGKSNKGSGSSDHEIRSLLYYYDETCHPYIWINETGCDFSRMVKQQYISLEDLRDFSEIRVLRDHHKGCISVHKKSRHDHSCFI